MYTRAHMRAQTYTRMHTHAAQVGKVRGLAAGLQRAQQRRQGTGGRGGCAVLRGCPAGSCPSLCQVSAPAQVAQHGDSCCLEKSWTQLLTGWFPVTVVTGYICFAFIFSFSGVGSGGKEVSRRGPHPM